MSFQGYTERIMNLFEYQQGDNKLKTTKKTKDSKKIPSKKYRSENGIMHST